MDDVFDSIFGKLSDVLKLPIEQQSKYADHICAENAKNIEFLKEQLDDHQQWVIDKNSDINSTSIGNLAYLALYSVDPYKKIAKDMLDKYIKVLS